jgi:hypothetical protein
MELDRISEIVKAAAFDRLIGEVEDQFLDVKVQPYQFDAGMNAKREFAKDVAAFSNSGGGYILVGLATKPATVRAGEEICEVHPVEHTRFDEDRHRKILSEWLYPQPSGVAISWALFGADANKGIGVIYIPPQSDRSKPFLITRSLGDKKSTEVLLGYVERRVDGTEVRSVIDLHQALRTGINLERELLGRIENIELLIRQQSLLKLETETAEKREQILNQRIERILDSPKG